MVALQSRSNASSGPRELFSISQVEKAFGAAYMPPGSEGCVRAWGERYLTGLKEPELSYSEALALPERTTDEKRERSSYIAKTFGKALEQRADDWFQTGTARFDDEPGKRLFPGLHLLPHPSQLDPGGYLNQQAVSVKLFSGASPEALSFQGFKDAIFLVGGSRFLVDYKTTKPKVDNRKNTELGKPAGWWTWMKTPEQLLGDYQWNLYQWDEFSKHERFVPSRWVYFASQETPQARAVDVQLSAIDPDRVRSICTQLADRANVLRGHIRGWRASTDRAAFTAALPKNITSCNAFGRLCAYHQRSPGGTCAGGDDQVIPVGQLLSTPNARPIKPVSVGVFEPGAFQFSSNSPPLGAQTDMSIRDQINQQLAQAAAQAPAGAPPQFSAPPPQQFVPQGAPPQGAPPPGAQAFPQAAPMTQAQPFAGAPFQPAPGQPGYAPGPQPHVGPPEYAQAPQQGYTPQAAPQPAPSAIPPQPIAQAIVAQQAAVAGPLPYGTPYQGYTGYFHDGQGGHFQGQPQAAATVQTSPIPAVAQASTAPQGKLPGGVQVSSGAPPEQELHDVSEALEEADLTALGALFLTLIQSAIGMLEGGAKGATDAPKKSRGRPKKSA